MQQSHNYAAAMLLALGAMFALGCEGSTEPGPTAPIQITIATDGASGVLDPDGYTLRIDGVTGHEIGINATVMIAPLSRGKHVIQLDGLAPSCSVFGTNPRSITVRAAPITVVFYVACRVSHVGDSGPSPWDY